MPSVNGLRAKSDDDESSSGSDSSEQKSAESASTPDRRQAKKGSTTSNSSNSNSSSSSSNSGVTSKNTSSIDFDNVELSKMEFSRAVKVAKAKAELDKLMNGPDPPFDYDAELDRVVGGLTPPLDAESPEAIADSRVHAVETDLFAAAAAGDYDRASALKTKLGKMHIDDCGSVLQVNAAFYRAFSEKDYDAMSDLWLHDSTVCCIHPSHSPLVGAKDVLGSWKQMFGSADASFQHNRMEPTNVRLSVKGTTAIVTCDEEVSTRRFVRGRKRQTELVNRLTATNIFRRVGMKWHMVHHHSSWHADSDAARNALSGRMGGSRSRMSGRTSDDVPYMTAEDALGIPRNEGITGKGYGEKSPSKKGFDADISRRHIEEGLENMQRFASGRAGDSLGGAAAGDGSNGPVKRVFMGSLSDLLNGGLSNIISDSIGSSKGDGEEGTIIQFEPVEDDDDDSDNDSDSDENGEPIIVRHIGKNDDGKTAKIESITVESSSTGGSSAAAPKDVLRQNCITALRKLAAKGEISAKQKRVLLTDIITCSAKGEFSMVEVAYELLCGEGEEESKDAAEEDFADQCRVFASSVPEFPAPKA